MDCGFDGVCAKNANENLIYVAEGDQRDKRESLRIIEEMVRNRGEYEPSAVDKTHNSDDLALIRAMDLVWTVMGPFIQSRKKDLGL